MRISASTFILFCNPPEENAKKLADFVPEVELMMDGDAWDLGKNGWNCQLSKLQCLKMPFSVHPPAWDVNPAAPISVLREAAAFLNKKAVEFCSQIGAKQIVYHPGYYDKASNFSRTRALDFSYRLLEEIISLAKPLGITIAYENIGGPSSALFTQQEYLHALDGIDPCVKYLLDIGHANMNGWNIPEVIDKAADRLCAFHLHDNNGATDAHLPIGYGNVAWNNVFAAMKQLQNDCLFVMEYATGTPLSTLNDGKKMLIENLC